MSVEPTGELAIPSGQGPWPGVVVIHEAYGLNDDIRACCERLAGAGYLTFAPDLYRGGRLRCLVRAFRDLSARRGQTFTDVEQSRRWLLDHPDCTGRVGIIGFCLGGGFALLAAAQSDYAVAAVNYGQVPKNAADVLTGACPIVASYGGRDRTLAGAAGKLSGTLTEIGVTHDVREYPAAGHGFLNHHTPVLPARIVARAGFRGPEAADAWRRIETFFATHLPVERAGVD
ncbi:carboxymethylenebutenolidase [Actinocatenispora thailandica]|uniref:Carboxymethylenebutenolidase n=1 Tax=Actinocatenispora thailandica TaxID=227318 RepID=A0A7R7HUF5_9ACTN|nr:dienelactone hydrolase family protein [Actinocatenispora thailandica]BCJ32523.1 carboxymethylenebutenolidase [Actinocatenispora thailandica]